MRGFFESVKTLLSVSWKQRDITFELARRELSKKYKGAALGVLWSAARPVTFVLVYWFAVAVGLRGAKHDTGGFPFILWLIPGQFAWFFITAAFSEGGNSVRSNKQLITKMVFPTITIPQFTILSLFLVHLGLVVLAMVVFVVTGHMPTIYWLQLPYYLFCSLWFTLVIATFLSALTAYSRDLTHLIKSVTQTLFWFSPILWPISNLEGVLKIIMKLNPVAYLTEGYREVFIYQNWFWETGAWTSYFLGFMLVFSVIAVIVWNKLQPEFADVL